MKKTLRRLRSTAFWSRYRSDVHFQNRISLHVGLTVNLAYIVLKLIMGVCYRSAWFLSLAVYYLLLAVMRLSLLRGTPENGEAAASACRRGPSTQNRLPLPETAKKRRRGRGSFLFL